MNWSDIIVNGTALSLALVMVAIPLVYLMTSKRKSNMDTIDCRSEVGITIGIIDSIITSCYLLRDRDLSHKEVQEAIKDLLTSDEFHYIENFFDKEARDHSEREMK